MVWMASSQPWKILSLLAFFPGRDERTLVTYGERGQNFQPARKRHDEVCRKYLVDKRTPS